MSNNLCTPNQASGTDYLGTTADFSTPSNCTLSSDNSWSIQGSRSLLLTGVGAGNMYTGIGGGASPGTIPIIQGKTYTFRAVLRQAAATHAAYVRIFWWNGAASLTNITSPQPTLTAAGAVYTISGVAPATANFAGANFVCLSAVAGTLMNVDQVGFWEGADSSWSMPGQGGASISDLERANLLASAPGAVATDTLSDLRLKKYKTATAGLMTVSDFEKPYLEGLISNETPDDTLYSLRRKYYAAKRSLSGVGVTTDDLHASFENLGA